MNNIYDSMLLNKLLLDNYDSVQINCAINEINLKKLDLTIKKLNENTKKRIKYSRTDIINLAIELYIEVLKKYN